MTRVDLVFSFWPLLLLLPVFVLAGLALWFSYRITHEDTP